MRSIGFSTGALAKGDFRKALSILRGARVSAVELSALRSWELEPLTTGIADEDLSDFSYVSVHAPSRYERDAEPKIVSQLMTLARRGWPVIAHPDAMFDFALWKPFHEMLLVENMDTRKKVGRTVKELDDIFSTLPDASFCFDVGHARQVDPTMSEALRFLSKFGTRLRQLHVSDVSTASLHERLTMASIGAFCKVAAFIPNEVPLILESPVAAKDLTREMRAAMDALPPRETDVQARAV